MIINGSLQLKHPLKSIDLKTTAHWITPNFILYGMVNVPEFINSEHLDVTSIPSHKNPLDWITEHRKEHSGVIPTAEQQ